MKRVALFAAVLAGSVLVTAPAPAAPLGAASRAIAAQASDQGLVEKVHRRRWYHRHRHHHHHRHFRPYYYYQPYYYRPYRYYYPYYYPYYYRRPGVSLYFRF